ncbi:MAG: dihydroorotate dehydrogenase electron transfer subunit [Sedimentisphaerales bacterium]|nr:dihydroorotate dehydrogenase electron transfer subunit [Sedimentisphaerales bacterium]
MKNDAPNPDNFVRRGEFVAKIVEQRPLFGKNNISLNLEVTDKAAVCFAKAKPGQFVNLACRDLNEYRCPTPLLRRPFSIAGIFSDSAASKPVSGNDLENSSQVGSSEKLYLQIIYSVIGPGTNWLAQRNPGEQINLLGPLGNGFTLPESKDAKVILVGGGVGLPPLYFLADRLAGQGYRDIVAVAGARGREEFACEFALDKYEEEKPLEKQLVLQQFARSNTSSIIATDDGSMGYHGNVVEAWREFLVGNEGWAEAEVFACGPGGMLKAVAAFAREKVNPCQVCMEAYMACGIGVCQSCVVAMKAGAADEGESKKYKLTCVNGPVFDAEKVDWNS